MKPILTLSALALACALSLPVRAATWTLGDTTTAGLRTAVVSLADGSGAMGSAGDALFGSITNDLDDIGPGDVAVGSWDATGAALGGNAIGLGVSHEAYAGTAHLGDAHTAYATVMTSASLDNASLVDAGLDLEFSAYAPARLVQNFLIAPELGESQGELVTVDLNAWASHDIQGNLSGDNMMLEQDFYSGFILYLNDISVNANSLDGVGSGAGSWSFQARIGDELRLELRSQSQIGGSILGMAAGATPELLASSEAFVSMTVTPVPEPETWAMLIMGLGLVGLRLRRKSAFNPILGA